MMNPRNRGRLSTLVLLGLGLMLVGCGDNHDKVTKDAVNIFKNLASTMESVKDEATAKAAAPKIEALAKDAENLADRAGKLPEAPKEKAEELKKKYEKEMDDTGKRLMENMMRINMDPKLATVLKDPIDKLSNAMQKLSEALDKKIKIK